MKKVLQKNGKDILNRCMEETIESANGNRRYDRIRRNAGTYHDGRV
jgi:hypothetical protein